MFVPIRKLVPSYLKVSSASKVFAVEEPVITLLPALLFIVVAGGTEIVLQVGALPDPPLVNTCPDVP